MIMSSESERVAGAATSMTARMTTTTSGEKGDASRITVVVAIDASKQSEESLQYYLDNIHKRGNQLILLHVIELPDMSHARQAHLTPSALYELWTEESIKSKELEERYTEILKDRQLKPEPTFRTENGLKPGEVIVRVVAEEQAAMVVMGTRGMGLVRRTILGSASDYVVHHATCPVVVCRRRGEDVDQDKKDSRGRVGSTVSASIDSVTGSVTGLIIGTSGLAGGVSGTAASGVSRGASSN